MIGQWKHGRAALAPILVECLRAIAMEMMNVLIASCVDLIIALVSSHLLLTVVLNHKSNLYVIIKVLRSQCIKLNRRH